MAVGTSAAAISPAPFTSAGLSGSEGSAAMRSHSTRSADCAWARHDRARPAKTARPTAATVFFMVGKVPAQHGECKIERSPYAPGWPPTSPLGAAWRNRGLIKHGLKRMIRRSGCSGGSSSQPLPRGVVFGVLGCSLHVGRNRRDRLQHLRRDLVGVALRVRTAIFQIALVAIVGERVRNADRSAAVGNTPAEGVDRGGLVLAGQAHVVVRAIDRDVVGAS